MPKVKQLPVLEIPNNYHTPQVSWILNKHLPNDCINEIFKFIDYELKMKDMYNNICSLFDYYEDEGYYYPQEGVITHYSKAELIALCKFLDKETTSKEFRENEYSKNVKFHKKQLVLKIIDCLSCLI